MAKKTKATGTSLKSMTFEQAISELEAIIERIEQGKTGLEKSLEQTKRGEALISHCRQILDAAEQELKHLNVDKTSGSKRKSSQHRA